MIARLVGHLVEREGNRGVLDVHGVGYEVFAPTRALDGWTGATEPVTVHVSTHVREDAITLYGFATPLDRQAFGALTGVTGVGPKIGLATLDALPPDALALAIERDDVPALSRIPGVGKKTALRLALELKGKLPVGLSVTPVTASRRAVADDLALALAQLDYGKSEIDRAAAALERAGVGVETPLPQRLSAALRALAGHRSEP